MKELTAESAFTVEDITKLRDSFDNLLLNGESVTLTKFKE